MSILEDIVEETNFTPKKSKPVVKWVIRISFILIGLAFAFGGFKQTVIFELNEYRTQVNKNTEEINLIKKEIQFNQDLIKLHGDEIKENNNTMNFRLDAFETRIDNNSERLENHIYNDAVFQNSVRKAAIKNK